jgi:hypothetical protein
MAFLSKDPISSNVYIKNKILGKVSTGAFNYLGCAIMFEGKKITYKVSKYMSIQMTGAKNQIFKPSLYTKLILKFTEL